MKGRNKSIKPQDMLILLKMIAKKSAPWRIIDLSNELDISPGEVTMGLERLKLAGLIDGQKRNVHKLAAKEFIVHGLKYVFPAELGSIERGVATAHSSKVLSSKIVSNNLYVWPYENGDCKGISISPIYESAPQAAMKDEKLYELMSLVDSLRIGKAREQLMAKEQLERELS